MCVAVCIMHCIVLCTQGPSVEAGGVLTEIHDWSNLTFATPYWQLRVCNKSGMTCVDTAYCLLCIPVQPFASVYECVCGPATICNNKPPSGALVGVQRTDDSVQWASPDAPLFSLHYQAHTEGDYEVIWSNYTYFNRSALPWWFVQVRGERCLCMLGAYVCLYIYV